MTQFFLLHFFCVLHISPTFHKGTISILDSRTTTTQSVHRSFERSYSSLLSWDSFFAAGISSDLRMRTRPILPAFSWKSFCAQGPRLRQWRSLRWPYEKPGSQSIRATSINSVRFYPTSDPSALCLSLPKTMYTFFRIDAFISSGRMIPEQFLNFGTRSPF